MLGMLISHSFGYVLPLVLMSVVLLLHWTMAWSFVKAQMQSMLHDFPILSKFVVPSDGNRSVWVASLGSCGRFKFVVWVNVIVDPSGRLDWWCSMQTQHRKWFLVPVT
jgi:hypothetical protein